ncbi:MAG: hypothetical protein Fur0018_04440 [Anaerolineales bacterium]
MRTFLHFTAISMAALLAVFVLLTLPLTLLALNTSKALFDPAFTAQAISDAVIDSHLIPQGLAWYAYTTLKQAIPPGDQADYKALLDNLSADDWGTLRRLTISDEMLTAWTQTTLDALYAWLENEAPLPDIQWDMRPFQENLAGSNGEKALDLVYDRMVACSSEQVQDFVAQLNTASVVAYPWCRMPTPWGQDQRRDYRGATLQVAAHIPAVFAPLQSRPIQGDVVLNFKDNLRSLRSMSPLGFWIPLSGLWLIAALVVRNWQTLAAWWGAPLLAGGLFTLGTAFSISTLAQSAIQTALQAALPGFPTLAAEIVQAAHTVLAAITRPMAWQGGLLAALGLALFLLRLAPKRQTPA